LGLTVDGTAVLVSGFAGLDDHVMEVIGRVAKAGEGIDDKDALRAPFLWLAMVDIVVFPMIEHLHGIHKSLGRAIEGDAEGTGFVLVPKGTVFDPGDLRGAFR